MSGSLSRIAAVARADVLMRVRRPASIAVFLALCALAWLIVPDPATGRTLMQLDEHRALLDSASISVATASLASILLGLLGFYLTSSTVQRDLDSRAGFIIAAMPVKSAEYLAGKYLGNAAFLTLVCLGYLLSVMGMHLLRGEAPIDPRTYVAVYLAMLGPTVSVVSALALLFECARPLSGRAGDLLYFFVWIAMMAVAADGKDGHPSAWAARLDVLGLNFLTSTTGGRNLSIGSSKFDQSLPPWTFPGMQFHWSNVEPRVTSALLALPLLGLALLFFARFDPAKVKSGTRTAQRNPLAQLNRWLKPATRVLLPLVGQGRGLARAVLGELALTLMLSPLSLLAAAAVSVAALFAREPQLRAVLMPLGLVALSLTIAEMATRDARAGTTALLYSVPLLQRHWVAVKFLAALGVALLFVAVPLARLLAIHPASALSLLIGAAFICSAAIAFGVLTGSPKTFTGALVLFMYLVMNGGKTPGFDFAGFTGAATAAVRGAYAATGAALLALAAGKHAMREGLAWPWATARMRRRDSPKPIEC